MYLLYGIKISELVITIFAPSLTTLLIVNCEPSSPQGTVASVRGNKSDVAIVPEIEIYFGGGSDFTIEAALGKDAAEEVLNMTVTVPKGKR